MVSLPGGVFQPYSGVKTSILLLDREFAKRTDEILFVKVENDGFDLGAQRRKIEKNDLPNALKALESWKQSAVIPSEVEGSLAFAVSKEKIAENGEYNLTGDRYRKIVDYSNAKWPMVELGEVCEILDSKRKPITKGERKSGIYPYYGATGILDYVQDYIFDEKLVLVGEDGAKWDRGDKTAFIATGKYWVNNHAHVLRPNRSKILDELLVEIINSMDLKTYISGITVPKLNQVNLKSIKIPLPPLEVQKQVVAEIEQYQKVIDGAKQVVENWKPSFRIDPNWPMIELGKVLYRLSNSIDPQKKQGNVNYVGLENIEPNTGRLIGDIETKYQNIKSAKTYFEPDQVLYGKLRPNLNKVFYTNFHGICSTDIFVLQGNRNKANHKFYSYYLRSKLFNDKVLQGLGGAQLPRVSWNYLSNIQVPLPSLKVQKQIVEEIETEQKIVNSNKKLIGKMEQKIEAKISEVWGDKN